MRTISNASSAASPLGHYSQATIHHGTIYVATQLGIDANNPTAAPGSIDEQARNALHNVASILIAAGSSLDSVLKVTIFLSDIGHWDAVNQAYAEAFGDHRPARGVIPVDKLHHGYDVAIDVIAALSGDAG